MSGIVYLLTAALAAHHARKARRAGNAKWEEEAKDLRNELIKYSSKY